MPADNRKFYRYNVEGEYFDEDSGIIKEIIYYPDTKEITFTFLDNSQKTVELANLVANTELSTLLARYITSDTLDITEAEESTNIEVPESYKNCYIVTRNDISDITVLSNDTYSITLSEEIEQVITGFKQNLYVDWVTEFPELSSILGIIKLTNCYPSKKINGDEEVPTYYIFSATDGLNDFSMGFFYEDDTWKVTITYGALADREYVSMEVSRLEIQIGEKSTIIPNPTLVGDEPDLEGAEIDGVKYKVGGGGKEYIHKISLSSVTFGNYSLVIKNQNNTPFTVNVLTAWLLSNGYVQNESYLSVSLITKGTDDSIVTGISARPNYSNTLYLNTIYFNVDKIDLYKSNDSPTITDTVTEV